MCVKLSDLSVYLLLTAFVFVNWIALALLAQFIDPKVFFMLKKIILRTFEVLLFLSFFATGKLYFLVHYMYLITLVSLVPLQIEIIIQHITNKLNLQTTQKYIK